MSLHSHTRVKVPWALLGQYLRILKRNTHPLQQPKEGAQMEKGRLGSKFNIISLQKQLPRSTLGVLTLEELCPHGSCTHSWLSTYLGLLCWPSIHSFLKIFFRSLPFTFFTPLMGCKPSADFGNKTSGLERNLYTSFEGHNSRALFHVSSTPLCAQERQLMEVTATRLALLLTFVEGNWVALRRPLRPIILGWLLWKQETDWKALALGCPFFMTLQH